MTERMNLGLDLQQARIVSQALDLYTRLGLGQLNMLGEHVRLGTIPAYVERGQEPRPTIETMERVDELVEAIKRELGFPRNGSYGIGHENVPKAAKSGWEVKKVIDSALAYHRDPNPTFKNVHYDGITLRYTDDPAPTAEITFEEPDSSPKP